MSDVQRVKEAISIVDVIGEYIKLQNIGNYCRGICPFHQEKSPSFFVNEQMGFFKCFGCGERGDALDFLQKYEGLTFREALEVLAKKAGITLTQNRFDKDDRLRERVLEILKKATDYFVENLQSERCQLMRDYLGKRLINQSTIKLFQLGATVDDWDQLTRKLTKDGYTNEELIASGLVVSKDTGRIYDRFRGRLMFPLKNHRGQVVGFSGRVIMGDETQAKYLNTPETMVYHKGKMLYGLHELNQEIKKSQQLLIVEGEFDMLSSVQAQVNNVCAIKGSALTQDHAKLINRYVKKVILALDQDKAGIEATKKAILTLREVGVELRVVMIDKGKDPDEYARTNPRAWREKVKQAVSVFDFFLTVILASHDAKCLEGQKQILQELAGVFLLIDNQLEYEFYLKKLALALGQDIEVIRKDLKMWGNLQTQNEQKFEQSGKKPKEKQAISIKKPLSRLAKLEAYVWFLFLQSLSEKMVDQEAQDYMVQTEWENKFLQKLAQKYDDYRKKDQEVNMPNFLKSLPADFQEKVVLLGLNKNFVQNMGKVDLRQEWQTQKQEHQQQLKKEKVDQLLVELKQLEAKEQLNEQEEERKNTILREIAKYKKANLGNK